MELSKKVLLIGHGGHGKDTVAEILSKQLGIIHISSSKFKGQEIYDQLKDKYGYKSVSECYSDRRNKRSDWSEYLDKYSQDFKARLTLEILEKYDMYVGMRNRSEFESSKPLFDIIIYVDASERVSTPDLSMEIDKNEADFIITNNGSEKELVEKIIRITEFLTH